VLRTNVLHCDPKAHEDLFSIANTKGLNLEAWIRYRDPKGSFLLMVLWNQASIFNGF